MERRAEVSVCPELVSELHSCPVGCEEGKGQMGFQTPLSCSGCDTNTSSAKAHRVYTDIQWGKFDININEAF